MKQENVELLFVFDLEITFVTRTNVSQNGHRWLHQIMTKEFDLQLLQKAGGKIKQEEYAGYNVQFKIFALIQH